MKFKRKNCAIVGGIIAGAFLAYLMDEETVASKLTTLGIASGYLLNKMYHKHRNKSL